MKVLFVCFVLMDYTVAEHKERRLETNDAIWILKIGDQRPRVEEERIRGREEKRREESRG